MLTTQTGDVTMLKKRISVSQKRQITIPIDFFTAIGVGNEVECYVRDNAIVIRPVRDHGGAFDEEILADLITQGLSGNALLERFKQTRRQIRPAIESLLEEAQQAVSGNAPYSTYQDVFGMEEAE